MMWQVSWETKPDLTDQLAQMQKDEKDAFDKKIQAARSKASRAARSQPSQPNRSSPSPKHKQRRLEMDNSQGSVVQESEE